MTRKNVRRLGFVASLALGRAPARKRFLGAIVRRSTHAAKAILVVRVVRRLLRTPSPTVVSVRAKHSFIDVEAR